MIHLPDSPNLDLFHFQLDVRGQEDWKSENTMAGPGMEGVEVSIGWTMEDVWMQRWAQRGGIDAVQFTSRATVASMSAWVSYCT